VREMCFLSITQYRHAWFLSTPAARH